MKNQTYENPRNDGIAFLNPKTGTEYYMHPETLERAFLIGLENSAKNPDSWVIFRMKMRDAIEI